MQSDNGNNTTASGKPMSPAPFLHAPETSRGIFVTIFVAACVPLGAGVVFFGWRALLVTFLSVAGCVATESAYYRVTRTPSLMGRMHAAVTGLLLALTLPASAPWYVPLTGAAFAIIVGKAIFGGVGHFLWQPAIVGRLAVTVIFAPPLFSANLASPPTWPLLGPDRIVMGDAHSLKTPSTYRQWRGTPAPPGADAFALPRPQRRLRELTLPTGRPPASISSTLRHMPPAWDLISGAHGGGIGETCAIAIIIAGLYLIYRNYVRGHLPGMFILAAAATAAIAPIRTGDGTSWQWLPIVSEGLDVGFTYVAYHLLCGELLLAGFFLAGEMTSRPVTAPAQAVFGFLCGAGAILLRMYLPIPIPAYAAVLICNTLTPLLDATIRPWALGKSRPRIAKIK
ncbi:MAG: RnfABCDGE type electron transport complex subunit D [Planctomycetota bacterium]|nr:RnfABCDGE type electron transport complex subunit D [Planctomycetota bacterium]